MRQRNRLALLWALSGGLGLMLLLVGGVGVWVQRSYTTPRGPGRRMDCEPIGMPHALGGLPGAVG